MAIAPFNYSRIRTKGITLIKKYGRKCNILVGGDANPIDVTKPWNVGKITPTTYPCICVVTEFATKRTVGDAEKICLVPGDFGLKVMDPSMRVQVLGVGGTPDLTYSIDSLEVYEPDGIQIGWKLRLGTWPRT